MIGILLVVLLGSLLGYLLPLGVPLEGNVYFVLGLLVTIYSVLEIMWDTLNKKKRERYWLTGFIGNLLLSLFLIFLSERLDVPLYLAVIFYFGVGIFDFFAKIRLLVLGE